MDLTPKQQASEAIRQAETVLILTGAHPSVDQAAAVVGLGMILRKIGKRVSTVMSDGLPASVAALEGTAVERQMGGTRDFVLKLDTSKARVGGLRSEQADDKLNIFITPQAGGFAPSDVTFDYGQPSFSYDLAIVLGVPARSRIDRAYEQNFALFEQIPLVNLDFHRSNEQYGAVNLIDPNASSLCEMLVATSESLQAGLVDAEIGTIFLMGIMAATDRFTAAHTTSKSLTVAAQMMAAGGRQAAVVKALYRDGRERDGRPERSGGDSGRAERTGGGERERNRNDRREGGARDGGGQRAEQSRVEQPRPETVRSAQSSAPRVETPRPEVAPRPNLQPTAPAVERRPEPILEPAHIEMEAPVAGPAAPAVQTPAPVAQTPSAQPIVQPGPTEPSSEQPRPAMADFAAAAELLAQQPASEPTVAPLSQPDQNLA